MSDPSAPSPALVHSIDLGEGDDAYRVVASFWRPPTAPEDTWRLEAFDPEGDGYVNVPDLTMNIPAGSLDQAPEELSQQAERHEGYAAPHLAAAALVRDQADMVAALVSLLAEVGRPEPSAVTPAPAPEEPRRKPRGPRVKDPAAAISAPGVPPAQQEAARAAVVTEPGPSAPTKGGKKAGRDG
jgi:hypothetical protein